MELLVDLGVVGAEDDMPSPGLRSSPARVVRYSITTDDKWARPRDCVNKVWNGMSEMSY